MKQFDTSVQAAGSADKQGQRNTATANKKARAGIPEWSAVRTVRLPHKVGLPLGSGGGGDDSSG